MITLAVCNHKGGTGKTTTSMNLAAAIGLGGRRVLVIDLDPQGFLTRMMGAEEPEPSKSSLILFGQDADYSSLPVIAMTAFDLLPASSALSGAIRKLNRPLDVLWVKEFVRKVNERYDLILLDTAAAVTVFTLNALVAADHVVIPVLPEYQPVLGGEQTYQTATLVRSKLNPSLNDPSFILTMVDARKKNHARYRHYLREKYPDRVFRSMIRTSTALSVTRSDSKTVFEDDPRARGSIDYANAADELISVLYPDGEGLRNDAASSSQTVKGGDHRSGENDNSEGQLQPEPYQARL